MPELAVMFYDSDLLTECPSLIDGNSSKEEAELDKKFRNDFAQWFDETYFGAVDSALKVKGGKWSQGKPEWLVFKSENKVVAFASLVVYPRIWGFKEVGKVSQVVISDACETFDLIPAIRSAIDDLFWFHESNQG